jgi:2-C-methyl-D-erythritol 4-phosphate cytidylyltransferase
MSARQSCQTCPAVAPQKVGSNGGAPDTVAIIVAGGLGLRFGDPHGKQYVELCGLPLMAWPILAFDHAPSIAHIVVVCAPERAAEVEKDVLGRLTLRKPITLAPSGDTRQRSVYNGLSAMPRGYEFVSVHDAARPLIETEVIEEVLAHLRVDKTLAGAICASRCMNTLKLAENGVIVATPDRDFYWEAQTPQSFRTRALVAAHKSAAWEGYQGTDDASLVERHGGRVLCVESPRDNLKVTVPEDLAIASAILEQRLVDACGAEDGSFGPHVKTGE